MTALDAASSRLLRAVLLAELFMAEGMPKADACAKAAEIVREEERR